MTVDVAQVPRRQPAPLAFSTAFGGLMAASAAVSVEFLGLIAVSLSLVAMVVGLRYRRAATVSVLLTMSAVVAANPPPLVCGLSGLCAAGYLVLRHGAAPAGVVTTTRPTVIGMVGMTLVGILAASVPVSVAWLPLVAPPVLVVIFALAVLPFFRRAGA